MTRRCDIAVLGAGPAGVAAACRAAEAGRSVLLLDEGLGPGGQIWRHRPGSKPAPEAAPWLERLARSGAQVLAGAALFDAQARDGRFLLALLHGGERLEVDAGRLVLASGARELLLPFPGWTLPNVTGAGGLQALCKGGLALAGKRVVLTGSGPLLLAVAEVLVQQGAELLAVAEQAGPTALAPLALRLLAHPGKLSQALRFGKTLGQRMRVGWWPLRAEGKDRVESVLLTDGRREERLACDWLGVSFGLVPSVEVARLLGAAVERGAVRVGERQESSLPGLYACGEACGVAGAEVAVAEGQLAGLAAAGLPADPRLAAARASGRALAAAMDKAFALRAELLRPLAPDTLVCRCEDVTAGQVAGCGSLREARLTARVGMGPCQGRVCGALLTRLHGWEPEAARSPLSPVPLSALLTKEQP